MTRERKAQHTGRKPGLKGLGVSVAFVLFCMVFMLGAPRAFACDPCGCSPLYHGIPEPVPTGWNGTSNGIRDTMRGIIRDEHQITTEHILEEFEDLEEFLVDPADPLLDDRIFGRFILPSLMMMSEQLVHTAMFQTMIIGTLLDGKQQLEAQTAWQKLTAEAHRDYHPSHQMCVLGTNVRSLAAAERNAEYTTFVLSQRSIDRQMGNVNTVGARGYFDDHCYRLRQFREFYCNPEDNNNHMGLLCQPPTTYTNPNVTGSSTGIAYPECLPPNFNATLDTMNKDVDFARTIDKANTLDVDFYTNGGIGPGGQLSNDERDIFALASNLYSAKLMYRIPETALNHRSSQDELLDMRNIVAKRSVAEHSFNTIVGMKSMSRVETQTFTQPYMQLIFESLGLDTTPVAGSTPASSEMDVYLGNRPSYYAQMEVLTKRIFQSPDFFVNLYDEPTNVERVGVALQAIGLMQDFDTWNSYLRTEAMLSVILELELVKLNDRVTNQVGNMRTGGFEL